MLLFLSFLIVDTEYLSIQKFHLRMDTHIFIKFLCPSKFLQQQQEHLKWLENRNALIQIEDNYKRRF